MSQAKLGGRLGLAKLLVVEDAERELAEDEGYKDEADYLVVGVEASRLDHDGVSNKPEWEWSGRTLW